MGGTDEPENLVTVTVTQHAMFHFCNFQLWGNVEDYVAYRGLSGQISEAEFLAEKFKIFGILGAQKSKELWENNPELKKEADRKRMESWNKNRDKHVAKLKEIQVLAVEAARTPEVIEKKKEKFKEIGHQQGEKNSQYGKMWITDGTVEGSYRIYKGEPIPEGYSEGRVCCNTFDGTYTIVKPNGDFFEVYDLDDYCIKNLLSKQVVSRLLRGKGQSYKNHRFLKGPISSQDPRLLKSVLEEREQTHKNELTQTIQYYTELYGIYRREPNFKAFCAVTGYDRTQQNLCTQFKRYVESYEPQSKNQHTPLTTDP